MQGDLTLCIIWYISRTLHIMENSDIIRHIHVMLRHIQIYHSIFRTLCNSCSFRTLPYSESWHIENSRYIQNSVKVYSKRCVTLAYWASWHIQNFGIFMTRGIFKNPVYLGTFRDIKTGISFFHFNLTQFSTKFKQT